MPAGPNPMPTPLSLAISARVLGICGPQGRSALARAAGLHWKRLARLTNGEQMWYLGEVEAVCDALGLDIVEVVATATAAVRASQPLSAIEELPLPEHSMYQDDYAPAAFETDVEPGQDWDSGYDSA